MKVRYKNKLYEISDDRPFTQIVENDAVVFNKTNKDLGIHGYIDVTSMPYKHEDYSSLIKIINTTPIVYSIELSKQALSSLVMPALEQVEDDLETAVFAILDGDEKIVLGIDINEEIVRNIVYGNDVRNLILTGMRMWDAISQVFNELGYGYMIGNLSDEQLQELNEYYAQQDAIGELSITLKSVRALAGNPYYLSNNQIVLDKSFAYLDKTINNPKNHYSQPGRQYKPKSDGSFYGDCSSFVTYTRASAGGSATPLTTAAIVSNMKNSKSQFSNINNIPVGAIVTHRSGGSGHTGIVVGKTKDGEPVVAHCGKSRGVGATPISKWNKSFPINHVALDPNIMKKAGSNIPNVKAMFDRAIADAKGGAANTQDPASGGGGDAAGFASPVNDAGGFDGGDSGGSAFGGGSGDSPDSRLSKNVEEFVQYNQQAMEFVEKQTQIMPNTVPEKNIPENMRGPENYYPVFTGIVTEINKVVTTRGYAMVLTLKTPGVLLSRKKVYPLEGMGKEPSSAHPGVNSFTDIGLKGEDIIRKCMEKAGFDEQANVVVLQKNEGEGGSGESGTSSGAQDGWANKWENKINELTPNINSMSDGQRMEAFKEIHDLAKAEPTNVNGPNVDTNLANSIGGMGNSSSYEMDFPKVTERQKTLINVLGTDTEVYKGIWDAWAEWKPGQTGNGGYPASFDGLTLQEIIEAVCSATNYEAFFDEEGLFWYRPPQFDVNPEKGTRYYFTALDGRWVKSFTMNINQSRMFSGAYVSGLPQIMDTQEGQDIPVRADAYVEDPQLRKTIGWKPMVNGSVFGGGGDFSRKYIIDNSTAYYYALSQLDRANGEFVTGKIKMKPRPDLLPGRTIYFEYMDLVVYVNRIINRMTPGDDKKTYTELYYSYGRTKDKAIGYNYYGEAAREPRKGMTFIEAVESGMMTGGAMNPGGMSIGDIVGGKDSVSNALNLGKSTLNTAKQVGKFATTPMALSAAKFAFS